MVTASRQCRGQTPPPAARSAQRSLDLEDAM